MGFTAALQFVTILALLPLGATSDSDSLFTIQVASFSQPDQATQLAARLNRTGEQATTVTVLLGSRGPWTRVVVGLFASRNEARRHAERLLSRGLISEFLVTRSRESQRREPVAARPDARDRRRTGAVLTSPAGPRSVRAPASVQQSQNHGLITEHKRQERTERVMPQQVSKLNLAPASYADTRRIPHADPARLVFDLIARNTSYAGSVQPPGGLWLTGDRVEGLARLRWIAGDNDSQLIDMDHDGRVKLDSGLLAKLALSSTTAPIEAPLDIIDYVHSNEGLLLLVELTHSRHRYRLHIGRRVSTRGKRIDVIGGINLDNNYDSRINPYRRLGKKLDVERPPDGFDSLVAINPAARWFNQEIRNLVPVAHITFHELAEAHAKLELGLDYLCNSTRLGAHAVALQREKRLRSQRPHSNVVITSGSNRLLRSEEEFREFFSQSLNVANQR